MAVTAAAAQNEIDASERWVLRQAEALSKVMLMDARNHSIVPDFAMQPMALAVLLAGASKLPCFRQLAERARQEHQATAGHIAGADRMCTACGWFEAAVYESVTGRSLRADWFDRSSQERAQ
jgi:hypothetical protein